MPKATIDVEIAIPGAPQYEDALAAAMAAAGIQDKNGKITINLTNNQALAIYSALPEAGSISNISVEVDLVEYSTS